MNGQNKGTDGAISGMSGWPRALRLGAIYAAVGFAFFIVNTTSILMENPPHDRRFAVWEPFVWEGSSHILLVGLLFPALWLYDRYRPEKVGLAIFASLQMAFFVAMTLSHVAGMVALRKLAYLGIAGWNYDFSQGNLWLQLIYEARKDALSYLIYLGLFWIDTRINSNNTTPKSTRIALRDGGRTFFVDPANILFIEAAGNYIDVHTTNGHHLIRESLSGFARKLDEHFVRIHRSRIVNRAHIRSSEPTASGDVKIWLHDGRDVIASRRFKAALKL